MTPSLSASFANSSGVKSANPFNVVSGGGNVLTIAVVAAAAVALIALVLWFKRK